MSGAPSSAEGERPPFARRYPTSPEIDELLAAFEAGDFGRVRRRAAEVAAKSEDERVRAAARDLRRRIYADPTALYLLAIAVALLAFLYGHYLGH